MGSLGGIIGGLLQLAQLDAEQRAFIITLGSIVVSFVALVVAWKALSRRWR